LTVTRFAALILLAFPAFAGEYAILASGLGMHVDRHEVSDGVVRLYNRDGVTELPSAAIVSFEQDNYVPPPPAAAPASQATALKPPAPKDPKALIQAAALRSGLPDAFVQSVAKAESGLDLKAVSPKGAIGIMQLMPDTARALGADPSDPEQNIDAGTRLLRELLLKYGGDVSKALAAYNAGERAVERYHGVPPYAETQHYVNKVVRDYLRSGGATQ